MSDLPATTDDGGKPTKGSTVSSKAKATVSSMLEKFSSRSGLRSEERLDSPTHASEQYQGGGGTAGTFWQKTFKAPGSVKPVRTVSSPTVTPPKKGPLSVSSSSPSPAPPVTPIHRVKPAPAVAATTTAVVPAPPAAATLVRPPSAPVPHPVDGLSSGRSSFEQSRIAKFSKLLGESIVDLGALRKQCWKGIPADMRPVSWKLLLGQLPANSDTREETIGRKRQEYHSGVPKFMDIERSGGEESTLHQIRIDLPRTAPNVTLFAHPKIRLVSEISFPLAHHFASLTIRGARAGETKMMERILFIWAMLHPASGYVQGINDLLTPIILVFLSETMIVFMPDGRVAEIDVDKIDDQTLRNVEADSFWCLTKLLDGIQDNYTNDQPGIVRALDRLRELIRLIDPPLEAHIESQCAMYVEFAFRWINCLLLREFPIHLIIRMWDTYMAEQNNEGFSVLHIYACAALLLKWSKELREREMPDLMLFLQHLPTESWSVSDIEELLSQAYLYRTLYHDSHHLSMPRK